jgi:hypothetical protein
MPAPFNPVDRVARASMIRGRSAVAMFAVLRTAPVAELVDAPDSKSGDGNIVLVRVRPGAPNKRLKYQLFL